MNLINSRVMQKAIWIPFVIPAIIYLLAVGIIPMVTSLKMGFYEEVAGGGEVFVGLKNYKSVVQDSGFWNATRHSFFFSGFTVLGHLLVGFGLATLLNRQIKRLTVWRGLQFIPWLFPPAAASILWILIYQDQYGLLNTILRYWNLSSWTANWLGEPGTALIAVTITSIWNWYPFLTLTLLAGMQNIPNELYKAVEIDGGGNWAKFWFITVPHLIPVILTICLLDFIWTFRFFDMVWIMTRGGPAKYSEVLPTYLYKLAFLAYRFDRAAAVGGLMFIIMSIAAVIYLILYRRN